MLFLMLNRKFNNNTIYYIKNNLCHLIKHKTEYNRLNIHLVHLILQLDL